MSGAISSVAGSNDYTKMYDSLNPTGLKTSSGDSSAGVDVAMLKAIAEIVGANYMSNLQVLQSLPNADNTDQKVRDAIEKAPAANEGKGAQKRSEFINEVALGMHVAQSKGPDRTNSLGDILCELMVLLIKSSTERRQIERELGTALVLANVERSKDTAILEKAKLQIKQAKFSAWFQFGVAVLNAAVGAGAMGVSGIKNRMKEKDAFKAKHPGGVDISSTGMVGAKGVPKFHYQGSAARSIQTLNQFRAYSSLINGVFGPLAFQGSEYGPWDMEKGYGYEAHIQELNAMNALVRRIADNANQAAKDAQSSRKFFLDMMSQINKLEHDSRMQIMRKMA